MTDSFNGFKTLMRLKKPKSKYVVFSLIISEEVYQNEHDHDYPIANLCFLKAFDTLEEADNYKDSVMKVIPMGRLIITEAMTPYPLMLRDDPQSTIVLPDESWDKMNGDFFAMHERHRKGREMRAKELLKTENPDSISHLRAQFVNLVQNVGSFEHNYDITKQYFESIHSRQNGFLDHVKAHPEHLPLLKDDLKRVYGHGAPGVLTTLLNKLENVDQDGIPEVVTNIFVSDGITNGYTIVPTAKLKNESVLGNSGETPNDHVNLTTDAKDKMTDIGVDNPAKKKDLLNPKPVLTGGDKPLDISSFAKGKDELNSESPSPQVIIPSVGKVLVPVSIRPSKVIISSAGIVSTPKEFTVLNNSAPALPQSIPCFNPTINCDMPSPTTFSRQNKE